MGFGGNTTVIIRQTQLKIDCKPQKKSESFTFICEFQEENDCLESPLNIAFTFSQTTSQLLKIVQFASYSRTKDIFSLAELFFQLSSWARISCLDSDGKFSVTYSLSLLPKNFENLNSRFSC